jgi:hypothetical protein
MGERAERVRAGTVREAGVAAPRGKREQVEVPPAPAETQAAAPEVEGPRMLPEVPVERAEHRLASPSDRCARAEVSAAPSSAPAVARCP